jgi:hypothetical protein
VLGLLEFVATNLDPARFAAPAIVERNMPC